MLPQTPLVHYGPAPLGRIVASQRRALPMEPAPSSRLPAWMGVNGFVDIHCHVAPGLDDGPATVEEAAALAWAAYRAGTLAMVATPHRSLRYEWSSQARANGLKGVHERLPEGFNLFSGCELELSDEAWRSFEGNPRQYCLNHSRYVLVELPRTASARCFDALLAKLLERKFVPILAHAERCRLPGNESGQLVEWVRGGCLLQVTADAVSGRRGRRPREAAAAAELIRTGLAHFVASDAHGIGSRGPNLQPAYRVVSEMAGIGQAARLFAYNPLRVLRDEPIEA